MSLEPETLKLDERIAYEMTGLASPVTAEGRFDGYSFSFYARFDRCNLTLSRTEGVDAALIDDMGDYTPEGRQSHWSPEHVQAFEECFYIEVELKEYEGSYLPEDKVLDLVRMMCGLFDKGGRAAAKLHLRRPGWLGGIP